MNRPNGSIHKIVIRGDVAVFRNGGAVRVYRLTPARLVRLSKIPGYFTGSGILGFSGHITGKEHARALRAIPSEKRAQASRENGKRGGRPKKTA